MKWTVATSYLCHLNSFLSTEYAASFLIFLGVLNKLTRLCAQLTLECLFLSQTVMNTEFMYRETQWFRENTKVCIACY